MSDGVRRQHNSNIWSILGFNTGPRRRTSISLPTRNHPPDPFEKPDRHLGTNSNSRSTSNMGAGRPGPILQGQRGRYLRVGVAITLILILLFILGPKDKTTQIGQYVGSSFMMLRYFSTLTKCTPGHTSTSGGKPLGGATLGTDKCSKPHSPSKPIVQYTLMIDAGSTGSRIHVYRFNNCGPTPELEDEIFEQTPVKEGGSGLSAYPKDAEAAAKSLDGLMAVAMKSVPDEIRSCTPIAVKATAGLRRLGDEASNKILKAVRLRLENEFPFPVLSDEKGGVEVMDGKDEGVYAWITANYLLGKIGGPDKTPTAAVFDLGGGSTQIVFEPTFPNSKDGGMPEQLAEGDHKYKLSFGGRDFALYQHSYLGFGLMAAREKLHQAVVEATYEEKKPDKSWISQPIVNPCIAPGLSRDIEVQLSPSHPLGSSVSVTMVGPSAESSLQCRSLAEKLLEKDVKCSMAPCAFNGVHQPSLDKTFAREDVYLISFFYDRLQPLGMPESFTIRGLQDLVKKVCQGEKGWDSFTSIEGALDELRDRPETCLDLNFMLALLRTGYEMPLDREVKIAKKIKNNELGWCLGARYLTKLTRLHFHAVTN